MHNPPLAPRSSLTSLSKLRDLKLYDNKLSSLGLGLHGLSNLHSLDLSSNRLTSLEVGPFL